MAEKKNVIYQGRKPKRTSIGRDHAPLNIAPGVKYDGEITLEFETAGAPSRTDFTYWRGIDTTFQPTDADFDGPKILGILTKGMPEPFISKKTSIVAFGSCFADNISIYLDDKGYNVITKKDEASFISRMGDGAVNTYAILEQLKWGWKDSDEPKRVAIKSALDSADVFIFTLGLSEIWEDVSKNQVLWRIPKPDQFNPEAHKFRVCHQYESVWNLWCIHTLIKQHRPDAKIVFTLSPIPLSATFRDMPCMVANAASKAHLRSALDQFIASEPADTFYFPSYEFVTACFNHQWMEDRRHVHIHIIMFIMAIFEKHFCGVNLDVRNAFDAARAFDRKVGKEGHWAVPRKSLKYSKKQS